MEAVLLGRITPRGDIVQISVELVNTVDRTQMWGDTYNRSVSDIQRVQNEIANTISQKLRLKLTGAQETRIAKQPTNNPQAYQFYLNGIFYSRKRGSDNLLKSIEYLDQAIALDPNFALAYAELGTSYSLLAGSNVIGVEDAKKKAQFAIEKALSLDDSLADAHLALALTQNDRQEWANAEASYKRAIELNPSLVAAHSRYAFYLTVRERYDEALREIKLAQELDPLSVALRSTEGGILYIARRYDQAIEILQESARIDSQDTFSRSYLALALSAAGRHDEAVREIEAVAKLQGPSPITDLYVGRIYALAGKTEEAREILKRVENSSTYVAPSEMAAFYAILGETDKAFASLEKAYSEKDLQLQFLRVDPAFDSIRNDPRFVDLLRRMGIDK